MRSPFLVVVVALAVGAACTQSSVDKAARTVTTQARQPRPDTTAATTRTTDNAGWVDNGGRTSDETARTEMSGYRATEMGSERFTGTPGSGTPLPFIEPKIRKAQVAEGAGSRGSARETGSGAPRETVIGRVARARCDRETTCNRIGEGNVYATGEQCTTVLRGASIADVVAAACAHGFDETQLALCLTSIRNVPCTDPIDTIETVPQCERSALCVP
jgi:hypothetical protein